MVDYTQNFFKQERKATLKRLLEFIKKNGYKEKCPECGAKLDNSKPYVLTCPDCKPVKSWPLWDKTVLLARFRFGDGGRKHTINQYIADLLEAQYIREINGTYEALI